MERSGAVDPAFARLHEGLRRWVTEHWIAGGSTGLSAIQRAAIPPIVDGRDCLLEAPTAGGKTEAALFPLLTRIAEHGPRGRLRILYLAPLRALLNSLEARAIAYAGACSLHAFKWHGDVDQHAKLEQLEHPAEILLTTPESVEAILLRKANARAYFATLSSVVIDEVHGFAGDDRGGHLQALLARLERLRGDATPLQRVAMTATVGNPLDLAGWLPASGRPPADYIRVEGAAPARDYRVFFHDSAVDTADTPATEKSVWRQFAALRRELTGRRSIAFVRSRAQAEKLALAFEETNRRSQHKVSVRTHHGSVSRFFREQAEALIQLASESGIDAIISTSTLELGVDIGALDAVAQVGELSSPAALLQRVGRSGRRAGRPQIFRGFCTRRDELLLLTATLQLALEGRVESIALQRRAYHLIVHQVICLALSAFGQSPGDMWSVLGGLPAFAEVSRADFDELLAHMVAGDWLRVVERGELVVGEETERAFLGSGWRRLFAVFDAAPLYDVQVDRQHVGTLDERFVAAQDVPFGFALGGMSWQAVAVDPRARVVRAQRGSMGAQYATWHAFGGRDVPRETATAVGRLLLGSVVPEFLDRAGADTLQAARAELRVEWQPGSVVVVADEGGVSVWTWAGDRINRTLAMALTERVPGKLSARYDAVRVTTSKKTPTPQDVAQLVESALAELSALDSASLEAGLAERQPLRPFSPFARCLPERLLRATLVERSFDIEGLLELVGRARPSVDVDDSTAVVEGDDAEALCPFGGDGVVAPTVDSFTAIVERFTDRRLSFSEAEALEPGHWSRGEDGWLREDVRFRQTRWGRWILSTCRPANDAVVELLRVQPGGSVEGLELEQVWPRLDLQVGRRAVLCGGDPRLVLESGRVRLRRRAAGQRDVSSVVGREDLRASLASVAASATALAAPPDAGSDTVPVEGLLWSAELCYVSGQGLALMTPMMPDLPRGVAMLEVRCADQRSVRSIARNHRVRAMQLRVSPTAAPYAWHVAALHPGESAGGDVAERLATLTVDGLADDCATVFRLDSSGRGRRTGAGLRVGQSYAVVVPPTLLERVTLELEPLENWGVFELTVPEAPSPAVRQSVAALGLRLHGVAPGLELVGAAPRELRLNARGERIAVYAPGDPVILHVSGPSLELCAGLTLSHLGPSGLDQVDLVAADQLLVLRDAECGAHVFELTPGNTEHSVARVVLLIEDGVRETPRARVQVRLGHETLDPSCCHIWRGSLTRLGDDTTTLHVEAPPFWPVSVVWQGQAYSVLELTADDEGVVPIADLLAWTHDDRSRTRVGLLTLDFGELGRLTIEHRHDADPAQLLVALRDRVSSRGAMLVSLSGQATLLVRLWYQPLCDLLGYRLAALELTSLAPAPTETGARLLMVTEVVEGMVQARPSRLLVFGSAASDPGDYGEDSARRWADTVCEALGLSEAIISNGLCWVLHRRRVAWFRARHDLREVTRDTASVLDFLAAFMAEG